MALPALDRLWFQNPKTEASAVRDLCCGGFSRLARSFKPKFLPTCENIFIAGSEVTERPLKTKLASSSTLIRAQQERRLLFPTNYYARLAICTTAFLLCVLPVCASDVQPPPDDSANGVQTTANSVSLESPTLPGTQDQAKKPGK